MEDGNRLLASPMTLELKPVFIESATDIAMAQVVRIVILKGFFSHAVITPENRGQTGWSWHVLLISSQLDYVNILIIHQRPTSAPVAHVSTKNRGGAEGKHASAPLS